MRAIEKSKFASICIATALFWVVVFGVYAIRLKKTYEKREQDRYKIAAIASVARSADVLPNSLLISLLNLKNPSFLYGQSPVERSKALMRCPAILKARVFPMPPSTLGIEYKLREPIACLGGYKNIALDERGVVFFLYPFFAPKHLPVLNLPLAGRETLVQVQDDIEHSKEALIGSHLIKEMNCLATSLQRTLCLVDVSLWNEANFFRKEVVVGFSHLLMPDKVLYVRIHPKTLKKSLQLLHQLLPKISTPRFCGGVLDMRFPGKILATGEVHLCAQTLSRELPA